MYLKTLCLLMLLHYSARSASSSPALPDFEISKTLYYQQYTIKLIHLDSNTYGYEIYSKKKLLIRQNTIPGIPGNKGFTNKSDAQKIARLVITKLSKGIMPPTVEKQEMDQLRISY